MSILDFEQEQTKKFEYELVEDIDSNRESLLSDVSIDKLSPGTFFPQKLAFFFFCLEFI